MYRYMYLSNKYIYIYAGLPMRLHLPIFTGRYLQKTDFLGQEEKRQTLSNFRDLAFPISSFPILLDVTFQLPGFPTFQLPHFPTFQLSSLPTFQHSNFPTFLGLTLECWKVGMLESWKVRPKNVGKLESWNAGKLECWKVRPKKLESWKVGMLESWNVGMLKLESWKVRPNKVGKLESEAQKHWTKAGKSAQKT